MNGTQNYWKLGLFVVVGVAVLLGALVFLGLQGSERSFYRFHTYFDEPVEGLEVGAPVKYRGIRIGEVVLIRSAPDLKHIEVVAHVFEDVLTDLGLREPNDPPPPAISPKAAARLELLRVQLVTSFLTGVSFIETDFVDPTLVPPKTYSFEVPDRSTAVVVDALPSTLKSIEQGLDGTMRQLPALLDAARGLVLKLDQQVERANIGALAERADGLIRRMDAFVRDLDAFPAVVAAAKAFESAATSSEEVGALASALRSQDGPIVKLSESVQELVTTLNAEVARADVPGTTRSVRGATDEAAELAQTLRFQVRELERALDSFRRVMDMIERDPGALLRGKAPSSPGGGNR